METALENSVWVTSPEFAGWLVKRGFRWRKLWTKRCVFTSCILFIRFICLLFINNIHIIRICLISCIYIYAVLCRWVALHGTEIAYMAAEPTDSTKDMVITKSQILPSTVINRDDIEVSKESVGLFSCSHRVCSRQGHICIGSSSRLRDSY